MKKNILIAGILSALSLAAISQASNNPWEYYWPNQKRESYSQRCDSSFGGSIKGMYAFSTEEIAPDLGGALLDLHVNIESGSVFHELSINSGVLYGSKTYYGVAKMEQTAVPLMFGYTLNVPMSEVATFYLGGKIGATFSSGKFSIGNDSITANATDFTFSALIGFKFAVSEKVDFVIGYEMYKFEDIRPHHAITAGFSWMF
ncbi:outer membrane beta-barrel protein [Akkermansia biwaensis]